VDIDQKQILVVDDNRFIVNLLRVCLEQAGYAVVSASTGLEALKLVEKTDFHLVLLDVVMHDMDGFEVVRQLRNNTRTSHLPVILLSSRNSVTDKVKGLELGADDYMTKPFESAELLARVMAHLRRARRARLLSPLTGLPGNAAIEEELRQRVDSGLPFAVLYIDMDNFKAYNDAYGFLQGDEAIKLLAYTLQQAKFMHGNESDLVGHIGGDDFVIITTPERVDVLCQEIISHFDSDAACLYDDRAKDMPIITLSIAVVDNEHRPIATHWEIGELAAKTKHQAKSVPGSIYVKDSLQLQTEELQPDMVGRSQSSRKYILVVDDDRLLSAILQANLEHKGYRVILAGSVVAAVQAMRLRQPDLLILDVVLPGTSGFTLCRRLKSDQGTRSIPVLMVSGTAKAAEAKEAGADAFLAKPFSAADLMRTVHELLAVKTACRSNIGG
jgi:diguanylate cyclase (GGDEF)-like protein